MSEITSALVEGQEIERIKDGLDNVKMQSVLANRLDWLTHTDIIPNNITDSAILLAKIIAENDIPEYKSAIHIAQKGIEHALMALFLPHDYQHIIPSAGPSKLMSFEEIANTPDLDEKLIYNFSDYLDMDILVKTQTFSKSFINTMKDKIDWNLFSANHLIDVLTMSMFGDYLVYDQFKYNPNVRQTVYIDYADLFDLDSILNEQGLLPYVIDANWDKISTSLNDIVDKTPGKFVEALLKTEPKNITNEEVAHMAKTNKSITLVQKRKLIDMYDTSNFVSRSWSKLW
jgi:hypothetical protein